MTYFNLVTVFMNLKIQTISSILNVKYVNVPLQQLSGLAYVYFKKTGKVGRFSLLGWPSVLHSLGTIITRHHILYINTHWHVLTLSPWRALKLSDRHCPQILCVKIMSH